MHSFDAGSGHIYFHNGDFSGNISWQYFETGKRVDVSIPFEDMKELVAEYIRQREISKLEEMTVDEVLSMPEGG